MSTAQNYASLQNSATPLEPTAPLLPLVATGNLFGSLCTLTDIYQLSKNPHFVAHHGRLLTSQIQQLNRQLDNLIAGLDPLLVEALSSHPIQA